MEADPTFKSQYTFLGSDSIRFDYHKNPVRFGPILILNKSDSILEIRFEYEYLGSCELICNHYTYYNAPMGESVGFPMGESPMGEFDAIFIRNRCEFDANDGKDNKRVT